MGGWLGLLPFKDPGNHAARLGLPTLGKLLTRGSLGAGRVSGESAGRVGVGGSDDWDGGTDLVRRRVKEKKR